MSRRKVEINRKHAKYEDIERLYKEEKDGDMKLRYLAMLKFFEGYTSLDVANMLHVAGSTVREWLGRYNQYGHTGLIPQKRGGSESKLNKEQLERVSQALQHSPRENGYNKSNWSIILLKRWISREFGVSYSMSGLTELVHKLGFSLQRPKKQCKAADPKKQEQFKAELEKLLKDANENTVEDEAVITDEPTTRGKWSLKGQQPIIPTNSRGSRKVIYGAANPKTGEVFYAAEEAGNSDGFESFLK